MRPKNKLLKFVFILLSIFLASVVTFFKVRERSQARDEERAAEELQALREQENMIIISRKRR